MKLLDIMTAPWALTPSKFTEVQEIYLRHVRGQALSMDDLERMRASNIIKHEPKDRQARELYQNVNGVAVIAVEGVIAKKMNLFMDVSGGTSTQILGDAVRQALDDPSVQALVLNIDSPGGSVDGTQEVARQIFAARGQKPIVAYTDGMMASAAYWIGAAADQLYVSGDTTEVGSIGVVATHVDVSKMQEARGVKTTEIVAGKFKRVASSYAPLSDMGRATIQEQVDHVYSVFVQDVAAFRGVTPETVIKDMADGRIFLGQTAVTQGLVDGQRSLDSLLRELAAGHHTGGRMSSTAKETIVGVSQADLDTAVREAQAASHQAGFSAGKAEGLTLGAEQERKRIQDVQAQVLPGHHALVQSLMFDGMTTGPEAAVRVLAAERAGKQTKLEQFFADAPQPVPSAEAPAPQPKTDEGQRDKLIKEIQAREQCTYEAAALKASKEQPALFRNR